MGQKVSIDIQIEGDDSPIIAGRSLKGKVRVHVKRKLEPTRVMLHLLGNETTILPAGGTRKSSLRDERTIARAAKILKDTKGKKLLRGVYNFPFDFLLPSSLPSSIKFPTSGQNYNVQIYYFLRVTLGDHVIVKQFQVVSAPLPRDIVPCMVEPTTHELKSFKVLNKGFLTIGASVENSSIGHGETLRVSIVSRNDTSVNVKRVAIKLVEFIEFKAVGHRATKKIELEKMKTVDLPGLHKARAPKSRVQWNLRGGYEQSRTTIYHELYQDLVSRYNYLDFVVPKVAKDSYDGNLIQISHYLKITFFTKGSTKNPSIKIPIVVGTPPKREFVLPDEEQRPEEPIATVIFDEEIDDNETTVEVGSRAEQMPVVEARLLENRSAVGVENAMFVPYDEFINPPMAPVNPTAPTESVILEDEYDRLLAEEDEASVESDAACRRTPPRRYRFGEVPVTPAEQHTGRYPQMQQYGVGNHTLPRQRLPSYSYDTESGVTSVGNTPQRLGAAYPSTPERSIDSKWLMEQLLRDLDGSIDDYDLVVAKLREPGYKELFARLTPEEVRSILGHVCMKDQVKVALFLARHRGDCSPFTCAHCVGALQKTSDYFRANLVETLLPFCHDLSSNCHLIRQELNDWEKVVTARAFTLVLRLP